MSLASLGRSRMWPMDDSTVYPLPRKPAMVFALAGDSTMTRGLGIDAYLGPRATGVSGAVPVLAGTVGAGVPDTGNVGV